MIAHIKESLLYIVLFIFIFFAGFSDADQNHNYTNQNNLSKQLNSNTSSTHYPLIAKANNKQKL